MARDDFSAPVKRLLCNRVAHRCSNPSCAATTSGPHTAPDRFVSVGVASHITAASPCGPRFDPALSEEERSGLSNAIWLCQTCAKLVDSDTDRFSAQLMRRWKVAAEARTLRELGSPFETEFFPQPAAALHTPIPRIAGLTYDQARALLISAGWQPRMQQWSRGGDRELVAGNGAAFWKRGYWEIVAACPTGLAPCVFAFADVYDNTLRVVTLGEEDEDNDAFAHVDNWRLVDGSNPAFQRTASPPLN